MQALQQLGHEHNPGRIASATQVILDYVEKRNPAFFTYRFGQVEGRAMEAGLRELYALAAHAAKAGHSLLVTPVRRYYLPGKPEIAESDPGHAHKW